MKYNPLGNDTIVALSTPQGIGAIAVIRISGKETFAICNMVFKTKSGEPVNISAFPSHTIHLGIIKEGDITLDEVLLSVFKGPNSYTGEDVIEISCHGSIFIQQQLLQLFIAKGARMADAGEFSFRAFVNGKFDLSQAEAVADLISSTSATSHQVAMQQMRGGFSDKIKTLRENLINFASLIELELDFSEEDVEFANRDDLKKLIVSIQKITERLIDSFEVGNVIKNGIPVAIVGKPNAGKSTLLNVLLGDDRAIVSEIPGTTRDIIEDDLTIEGILFRFIDTAGIRETGDLIESMGVTKTFETIKQSAIIIYLFDVHEITSSELKGIIEELKTHMGSSHQLLVVANKIDKEDVVYTKNEFVDFPEMLFVSAKEEVNIDELKKKLVELFDTKAINVTETVVTNARHVDALRKTNSSLEKVLDGLNSNLSGELLASDVRNALHQLGLITGEITTDDLLANVFSKFCIGK